MIVYDIIYKKRNNFELTDEEIKFMITGFTKNEIKDYQMSAFLMAVWFNKMTGRERAVLTECMLNSGKKMDLSAVNKIKVDKHSTGGVGDGVSLSLAPIVAAAGVPVPMMSGRGLGHTGGTLDKLESIPGFSVELTSEKIINILKEVGVLIMGQTDDIVPADKKMYALRDVTATVDSIDLIAGSIMSKKLAEGMDALLLDVKTGKDAFMQKYEDSVSLAKAMIEIGDNLNKKMVAFITDMNQPLGNAVGNALEIIQSIEILKNNGPSDITKLVRYQAAQMILLGKKADSFDEALKLADEMITSGKALEVYKKMVAAQNGDISVFDDYSKFPQASEIIKIKSNEEGFISEIDAMGVGISSLMLGGGRENKDSIIDYAVGIVLRKKVGDFVKKGECLAEFYVNDKAKFETSKLKFLNSYKFSSEKPVIPPLIYSIITIDDTKKINIER